MRIAIIGAGAIGILYAHQLSTIVPTTVYVRRLDQLQAIQEQGLTIEGVGTKKDIKVHLMTDKTEIVEEIIIVTVKQYSLLNLLPILKKCSNKTMIFLQNGMGHLNVIEELDNNNLFVGVVEHGARRTNDTTIEYSGKGTTKLASYIMKNIPAFFQHWLVNLPQFPLELINDWREILLKKLLANAVINPLTALLNIENGKLLHNEHYYSTMRILFEEVYAVLTIGEKEEMWAYVTNICNNTRENRSSMLRDMDNKNQTEIDAILGYLMTEGERLQKNIPTITFLYKALKGKEIDVLNRI